MTDLEQLKKDAEEHRLFTEMLVKYIADCRANGIKDKQIIASLTKFL